LNFTIFTTFGKTFDGTIECWVAEKNDNLKKNIKMNNELNRQTQTLNLLLAKQLKPVKTAGTNRMIISLSSTI